MRDRAACCAGCYALDSPQLLALGLPALASGHGLHERHVCKALPLLVPRWVFGTADIIHTDSIVDFDHPETPLRHWNVSGSVRVACDQDAALSIAPSPDDGGCAAVARAPCGATAQGGAVTVLQRSFKVTSPPMVDCVGFDGTRLPVVSVAAAWELPAGSEAVLEVEDSRGFRDSINLGDHGATSPWSRLSLFPLDMEELPPGRVETLTVTLSVHSAGPGCSEDAAVALGSVRLHSVHVASPP